MAFAIVFCGFGAAAANQLRVQWFGRARVLQNAVAVHRLDSTRFLTAQRGAIYSSDDKLLAWSTDESSFGLNPKDVPLNPALYRELSNVTGIPASELYDCASRGGPVREWPVGLNSEQTDAVDRIKRKYSADGIWCKPTGRRTYPLLEYGAPVVGFVDNGVGRAGIEQSYEKTLRGTPGMQIGVTDGEGEFLPWTIKTSESKPKIDGKDVHLTIDSDLQTVAMKSLAAACESNKAKTGICIVMRPDTGDVLALASWPTFHPDEYQLARLMSHEKQRTSPELNPNVAYVFEPGSTFKLFTIALGLDSGVVHLSDTVNCTGSKQFSTKVIHCAHGARHGLMTPDLCIEQSCNLAAATWAVKIGYDRYYDLLKRLNILKPAGVGLAHEAVGQFRTNEFAKLLQMANLGFGQSINVAPLRLAAAFTVFANHGIMCEPRLVASVGGDPMPPAKQTRIFSAETADRVRRMMELCIDSPAGTGHNLKIKGYALAGKTGTAQKLGSSKGENYVSSFVGIVPSNQPKALVLVMIDSPSNGSYYGASVAGPVFRDVAQFTIQKNHLPPDRPGELTLAVR